MLIIPSHLCKPTLLLSYYYQMDVDTNVKQREWQFPELDYALH